MLSFIVASSDWSPGSKYATQFREHLVPSLDAQGQPYRLYQVTPTDNILTAFNDGLDLHAKELAYCEERGERPQNFNCPVLIHPDVELVGPGLAARLEALFADESIAVAGVIGARQHPGLRWWEGNPKFGYAHHKPGQGGTYFTRGSDNEVDIVDGMMIALSPWFAERFRFRPEEYEPPCWHVYGETLCAEAQMQGKRVLQIDYELRHHTVPGFAGGEEHWNRLDYEFQRRYCRHLWSLKKKWAMREEA